MTFSFPLFELTNYKFFCLLIKMCSFRTGLMLFVKKQFLFYPIKYNWNIKLSKKFPEWLSHQLLEHPFFRSVEVTKLNRECRWHVAWKTPKRYIVILQENLHLPRPEPEVKKIINHPWRSTMGKENLNYKGGNEKRFLFYTQEHQYTTTP